jgi:organic radical activating enzyme
MHCPLPFNHTAISTNGYYNVCCLNKTPAESKFHLNDGDFGDWQNNDYCKEVKQFFLENKQHPGCVRCWTAENQNQLSYRQRVLKEYKILGATQPPQEKLLTIEIAVGNLCNLSCLMCDESSSSVTLAENIKLNINKHTQKDFKWDENNFVALSKNLELRPKIINLRGGEPLYNKKIFDLLDSFDADFVHNTVLHITTNATVWTQEWARVFSKFKLVRMMFSIDAVGELYNYIRYPGNFECVENNIKSIVSNKNIKPLIHATVQNLNILYLGELIDWSKRIGIYLEFESVIHPIFLHFTNLPPKIKSKAISYLRNLIASVDASQLTNELISYIEILEQSNENAALWQSFISQISIRDNIRGNSFNDFLY